MFAERRAVAALRVFLVVLFGILVVFETLSLPGQFAHMAREVPEQAAMRWPLTAIAVFWVVCVQVVVVCTWKLLTLVKKGRIFTEASLRWVDTIIWAIAAAWAVLVVALFYVGLHADDPGMPMLMFLVTVVVTVVGLLVVVLRALLRQATTLRTDLDAVI